MTRTLVLGLVLLPLLAHAEDGALSPEQAADKVLEAVAAKNTKSLQALASALRPDPWLVADELCHRGEHDAARAFATAAAGKAIEALPAYVEQRRTGPPDKEARAVLARVNDALRARNFAQALEAATALESSLTTVAAVRVAYGHGLILEHLKRLEPAAGVLAACGEAARKLGWLTRAAEALDWAGRCAFKSDWRQAAQAWEGQLEILRVLGDELRIAGTLMELGILRARTGQLVASQATLEEALAIVRRQDAPRFAIDILGNLAIVEQQLGRLEAAIGHHEEALAGYRAGKDRKGEARVLNNLGLLHDRIGDYHKAQQLFDDALRISRALDDRREIVRTLGNVGLVQKALGHYARAIATFEDALTQARSLKHRFAIARAENNLGMAVLTLDEHARATKHLEKALAIHRRMGNRNGQAIALHNLGHAAARAGDDALALQRYEQSLAISRTLKVPTGIAKSLHNVAYFELHLGRYDAALPRFEEVLRIQRSLQNADGIARTLLNLGWLEEARGNVTKAEAHFQAALNATPSPSTHARLMGSMAKLHLARGEEREAIASSREAIELASPLARGLAMDEGARVREPFAELFETGTTAAVRAGDVDALCWFLEQGRSVALREALGSRRAVEAAVLTKAQTRALSSARRAEQRAFKAYRDAKESGKRDANKKAARRAWIEAESEVAAVTSATLRTSAAADVIAGPDSLAAIQQQLQPTDALVIFGLTDEDALALIVRRTSARMAKLGASAAISAAVDAVLDGPTRFVEADKVPALRKLLVTPLALGADVKRVLVSPTGRLGYLPFTLLWPGRDIACIPSGTTLGLLSADRQKRGRGILGLGDPIYDEALVRLGRLPKSREEVEAIASEKLLGKAATEENLTAALAKQTRWRAVHLACHGFADAQRPMLSLLAITPGPNDDGRLTALEVFRMKIPADLVALSACQTGKGKIYKTEGIVGLTRAFMFAGAPRVLCSLWDVDDDATGALMTKFYELWNDKTKPTSAAAALRQAQAHVRGHEKWAHEDYWAGWALWGLPD